MSMLLSLLAVLAGVALRLPVVAADDAVTSIDFYTDVLYDPPEVWHSQLNSPCGTVDHYTTALNASVTVQFTGNKIVVDGMQNSASGVLEVAMDNEPSFVVNLWSQDIKCSLFFEYDVGNDTHTLKLTLRGIDPPIAQPDSLQAVLHLTSISYWTPLDEGIEASVPAAADDPISHHVDVGAIVGGAVCGVVGAILLFVALFLFIRRRRARKNRHSFNPSNTVYITSLSPSTPTTPYSATKLQPYARMDDDIDAKTPGHLDVPPPSYQLSMGGLRARSRSPAPDRKSMP